MITFECKSGQWVLTQPDYDRLVMAYPSKDIDQELRSAQQWCINNPSRRKTAKTQYMMKFLCNWMGNAQDRKRGFIETHADVSWAEGL